MDLPNFDDILNNKDQMAENERQCKLIAEEEEGKRVDDSNSYALIPKRFSKTRIGDFDLPFNNDGKEFCLKEKSDEIFLVSGCVGSGKTSFLTAMLHERAAKQLPVGLYLTGRTIVFLIKSSRSFTAKENEFELYSRLASIPFIVYDEAGSSEDQEIERNFIRTMTALRYDNCLSWAIGTNLSGDAFKKFVAGNNDIETDSIISRMKSVLSFHILTEGHRR